MGKIIRKNNKKGIEMSTSTIIAVILLVIGFGILLMFITRIYFSTVPERAVCKESVNLRAAASAGTFGVAESLVDLNCKTQRICITSKWIGGKCKEFEQEKTEEGKDVKVIKARVDDAPEVAKVMADEVYSCWNMMGQGKLSLFSPGWIAKLGIGNIYSSCVICSLIAFDGASLDEKEIDLDDVNVAKYMRTHLVPGKRFTYEELISGSSQAGVSVLSSEQMKTRINIREIQKQENKAALEEKRPPEKIELIEPEERPEGVTQTKELAVVFMQIAAPSGSDVLIKDLALLGITGAGSLRIFGPSNLLKAGKAAFSNPYVAAIAGVAIAGTAAYQAIRVYRNYDIANTYCGSTNVGKDTSYGCSSVKIVTFDAENLKKTCGVIESIL